MGFDVSYFSALLAGVFTFLSPCVLPLIPGYLCLISGQSLEQLTGKEEQDKGINWGAFKAGLAFMIGLSLVFIAMGATASSIGQFIAQYKREAAAVGGHLIMLFGLHFTGIIQIPVLNYMTARVDVKARPASLLGAFIFGMAFAFGWSPCVGPILGMILMIAGSGETVWYGVSLLAVFSMGLGIPFLLAAIFADRFMGFLARFRKHMRKIEISIGLLLFATGLLITTGWISDVTAWLLINIPILQVPN